MSVRDDYPAVAILADAAEGRTTLPEAVRMLHEIAELRLKVAWLENIAEGRGEENERLREAYRAQLVEHYANEVQT
jgi:L-alanine-DL-glutamate epimerase-like enolase superfamily enzyme